MQINHYGAVDGVTGSCHELMLDQHNSVLVDCGLFQGNEQGGEASADRLAIEFDLAPVKAVLITHAHIDHIGRLPFLLAAGFRGPIYATPATCHLLPLMIEDAMKVGVTRDRDIILACLRRLQRQLVPVEYRTWHTLHLGPWQVRVKFQPAGHILGSAYIECEVITSADSRTRVVFSGDLGAPYAPLLPAPKSPYRADLLVLESTYGDRLHEGRHARTKQLQRVIERALANGGTVLIPAFSLGRTQELLYEIEQIIYRAGHGTAHTGDKHGALWEAIDVVVDSPLAARLTDSYKQYRDLWDKEASRKVNQGRHPLSFENMLTVSSHADHLRVVNYLASSHKPAIVIAASGMCSGGRIVDYLRRLLPEPDTDILFVGYQAEGTPGRDIQQYGPKGGYVMLNGEKVWIRAGVHTLSGYSAHADRDNLVRFVKRIRQQPKTIRLVHGDMSAKLALKRELEKFLPPGCAQIPDYGKMAAPTENET